MTPSEYRRLISDYPVTLLYLCVAAMVLLIIAVTDATK